MQVAVKVFFKWASSWRDGFGVHYHTSAGVDTGRGDEELKRSGSGARVAGVGSGG